MFKRFRRLRINPALRDLVRQTDLQTRFLIYPLFVVEGSGIKKEIASMPGVFQMSIDEILKECETLLTLGLDKILLFGIPSLKDSIGSDALSEDGIIATSLCAIKAKFPNLLVITDLCFCEYTDHGHCGILHEHYTVDNDATLPYLCRQALSFARAGVDMVAPSDMMDGRIAAMREALDREGYEQLPIMSYAAKFSSAFYGPFRDAAGSAPAFGDRRSYQMDPANIREAMREIESDIAEGADIVMVKPAMPYLDVIRWARDRYDLPLAAYQVSGEYAMIQAAGMNGWIDRERIMMESLLSIKRAGADLILTYFAREAAALLREAKY